MTMLTNKSMPSSARATSSGFVDRALDVLHEVAVLGRPDVEDAQFVLLGEVGRHERPDHPRPADQEDLHRATPSGSPAPATDTTLVRAMTAS